MKQKRLSKYKRLVATLLIMSLLIYIGRQSGLGELPIRIEADTIQVDMTTDESVIEEQDTFQVIAHALGQVEGRQQTNSREAFLQSVNSGYTLLEADFQHTSDGVMVLRHDFEENSYYVLEQDVVGDHSMTLDEYMEQKINYKYTPLTLSDLFELMDAYPDVHIVTDTKNNTIPLIEKDFTTLIKTAEEMEKTYLLDRFIVQLYNKEMYDIVHDIYPFENYILTVYQLPSGTEEDLAKFCSEKGIGAMTLPYARINGEVLRLLKSYDLDVYIHTLNRLKDVQYYLNLGVDGIYTDILTPEDIAILK